MFLIVGLGNPGREYEDTRHNVGFMVADELARRAGTTISDSKFKARVGRARIEGEDCFLMKPRTYMNLSGESVGPALGFFKALPSDLIVVHDDLDIEVGRLKLKVGGGHGGHNGLRSLVEHLPNAGFIRVRVGIGRPPPRWDPADYVLSRFRSEERELARRAVSEAADAVEAILRDGPGKAMNKFNRTQKESGEKESKAEKTPTVKDADPKRETEL